MTPTRFIWLWCYIQRWQHQSYGCFQQGPLMKHIMKCYYPQNGFMSCSFQHQYFFSLCGFLREQSWLSVSQYTRSSQFSPWLPLWAPPRAQFSPVPCLMTQDPCVCLHACCTWVGWFLTWFHPYHCPRCVWSALISLQTPNTIYWLIPSIRMFSPLIALLLDSPLMELWKWTQKPHFSLWK